MKTTRTANRIKKIALRDDACRAGEARPPRAGNGKFIDRINRANTLGIAEKLPKSFGHNSASANPITERAEVGG